MIGVTNGALYSYRRHVGGDIAKATRPDPRPFRRHSVEPGLRCPESVQPYRSSEHHLDVMLATVFGQRNGRLSREQGSVQADL